MTAKLTDSEREKRRLARRRGDRFAAASPYHHTPIPPRDLKRCPHCGSPVYSSASSTHPQCSQREWENRQWEEKSRTAADPAGSKDGMDAAAGT